MHVLALALASALAVEISGPDTAERETHPIPWYVPRTFSLGLFINPPVATPHFRIGWEIGVLEQPRNHLVALWQIGSGTGASLPPGFKGLYQHVAIVGVGYRSTREVFHWGFTVTFGALWYRASFVPGSVYQFENRVLSYSEAHAQAGWRVLDHLVIGVYAGYASPWDVSIRFPGNIYTGGPLFGFFADWR